jgi:hypothetical protein
MKNIFIYSVLAMMTLTSLSCRPTKSSLTPKQLNNGDLQLSSDAKLCTTTFTLMKVEASNEVGMKAATVNLQLGVCGTINGDGKNKWSAIAAGVISDSLQVADQSSLGKSGVDAKFLMDDSGALFVKENDGSSIKIGTFSQSRLGSLLKGESDLSKFKIVVGDRPYQLGKDPKSSADMKVWMMK